MNSSTEPSSHPPIAKPRRKTYGEVVYDPESQEWIITAPPHVMSRLKASLPKVSKSQFGTVRLKNQPVTCKDLLWFTERFPMRIDREALKLLKTGVRHYDRTELMVESVLQGGAYPPCL